jgi:hypothetical protein
MLNRPSGPFEVVLAKYAWSIARAILLARAAPIWSAIAGSESSASSLETRVMPAVWRGAFHLVGVAIGGGDGVQLVIPRNIWITNPQRKVDFVLVGDEHGGRLGSEAFGLNREVDDIPKILGGKGVGGS